MRPDVIPAGFEPAFSWLRAKRDIRYSKGPKTLLTREQGG